MLSWPNLSAKLAYCSEDERHFGLVDALDVIVQEIVISDLMELILILFLASFPLIERMSWSVSGENLAVNLLEVPVLAWDFGIDVDHSGDTKLHGEHCRVLGDSPDFHDAWLIGWLH